MAQSEGDYRTVNLFLSADVWSDGSIWQRYTSGSWVTNPPEGYPGQTATAGTVTIRGLFAAFDLNVSPPFNIGTLDHSSSAALVALGTTGNRTLTINGNLLVGGANSMTFGGTGNLTVSGSSTIDGTFTDSEGTGTSTFVGLVTNNGNWTTTATTNTDRIIFRGGIDNDGNFDAGGATFNTNNQTLSGSSTINFDNTVTVTGFIVTNNATVTMGNTAAGTLTGTGTWTQGVNSTLNYAGSSLTITTLNASNMGNVVNYNRNGDQTLDDPSANTYYNLTLSGTGNGIKSSSNLIDINGNLSIAGTAQFSVTNNINLFGNWTVTSTNTNPFVESTRTVTFDGTANQTISTVLGTGETFYNLVINKTSGRVLLATTPSTDIDIANAGTLTFTNGIITTTSNESLTFNSTSLVAGGTSTSYVDGPVRKFGSVAFTFPTGSGNYWGRIRTLPATGGAATLFTAQYFASPYSDRSVTAPLVRVSSVEYWSLTRSGTNATAQVVLYWEDGTRSGITSNAAADLRVARYSASNWGNEGNSARTGTAASGSVTSATTIATGNFTLFTFGTTQALPVNPLPIELLSFSAQLKNNQVELKWSTASETNNDYFTIERATDVEHFEPIITQDGMGTSQELNHYKVVDSSPHYGRSYYRLKQTDFDGKFTYSELRTIDYEGPAFATLTAFPNPLNSPILTLKIEGLKDATNVPVQILNLQGQKVFEKIIEIETPGIITEEISRDNFPSSGLYIIKAGETLYLTKKIVIE